ncbi:MAG TPA: FxLYD domain-containing protein [Vineibacter sp.]|nr:FxLYD domain-containing protein [Vineibacter sp.]
MSEGNAAALPEPTPVPDFIIRPPSQPETSYLPAIPVDPGMPLWLKTVLGALFLIALLGGGVYLFRDQLFATLAVDQQTAKIVRAAGTDGKTVITVTGDIVNVGRGERAAKRLRLKFKDADGKVVAERIVAITAGGIPPRGRTSFEARVEDAPTASTIEIAAE